MTIYGEPITEQMMTAIASYMDDEIRERVHRELAPCTPDEFIQRYLELDPDFQDLLESEFDWEP